MGLHPVHKTIKFYIQLLSEVFGITYSNMQELFARWDVITKCSLLPYLQKYMPGVSANKLNRFCGLFTEEFGSYRVEPGAPLALEPEE